MNKWTDAGEERITSIVEGIIGRSMHAGGNYRLAFAYGDYFDEAGKITFNIVDVQGILHFIPGIWMRLRMGKES